MRSPLPSRARQMRLSSFGSVSRRGTSLIEVLVVIVVFLVGILAVAQIFPGGFRILAQTRARSLATTIARAESERLKARADLLPEAIIPIRYERQGGVIVAVVDSTKGPRDFAPTAVGINGLGQAVDINGGSLGEWQMMSGANTIRRIVAETHRIGAPRFLSPTPNPAVPYGGLVTLQFGPVDFDASRRDVSISVYGRDMLRRIEPIPATLTDSPRDYEYILTDPQTPAASITLPARTDGSYRLALTVFVNNAGTITRREISDLPPLAVVANPNGYATILVSSIPGVGAALVAVEPDSVRLARNFNEIDSSTPFSDTDAYQYRVISGQLGQLLFNPLGYNLFEQRPGESRRPFSARINYDVFDWRILREDFRIQRERFAPSETVATQSSVRLSVSPMKTVADRKADGRNTNGIEFLLTTAPVNQNLTQDPRADHFFLIDLETGGVFFERLPGGQQLIDVNKSTGRVRFISTDPTGPLRGRLQLPNGDEVDVAMENRAVRALYMAKDEWAVQVLRAPARYTRLTPSGTNLPTSATYYLGGNGADYPLAGLPTRIYFPAMDAGRKVSVGRIHYLDNAGIRRTFEGGDFVLRYDTSAAETISQPLPFADIRDVAGDAVAFDFAAGNPANGVRGASAVVRVFHNETKFYLGADEGRNLTVEFQKFLRLWKVDTKETFLTEGESIQ